MTMPLPNDSILKASRYTALVDQSAAPYIKGIHYITAEFIEPNDDDTWRPSLNIHFVPLASSEPIPLSLTAENFRILDTTTGNLAGFEIEGSPIYPAQHGGALNLLIIEFTRESIKYVQQTVYRLELIDIDNVEPFFSGAIFTNRAISIVYNDPLIDPCASENLPVPTKATKPEINYLTKDYESFRRLMVDRITVLVPAKRLEQTPVALENTIIEILAYAADHLSYYQDAVATEAYLGTSRQRISMKRHARLLDYPMHEGCNARVWVQIEVDSAGTGTELPAGTKLLTKTTSFSQSTIFDDTNADNYQKLIQELPLIFETIYDITLYNEHNSITIYDWDAADFTLPQGATAATLLGTLSDLNPGDVIVFEEIRDPLTGEIADADTKHRHAVRLTKVTDKTDPFNDLPITEIEWHPEDALPFALTVVANGVANGEPISVALGNIVLADHGKHIGEEPVEPSIVPEQDRYMPILKQKNLTFREFFDVELAKSESASNTLLQQPSMSYPLDLQLKENSDIVWELKSDLLDSQHIDQHFIAETDNERKTHLRFGDGVFGKIPSSNSAFTAGYRIGNGTEGNIGADSLIHIVTTNEDITGIRNPLPAQGGVEPEEIEMVRTYAPHAFKRQQRCVTLQDYIEVAERHPEVRKAGAARQWTGSWMTTFVTVQRKQGNPVDTAFKAEIMEYLQQFRLIDHDICILDPHYVPLFISLHVRLQTGYIKNSVKQALITRFNTQLSGFFYPDNFTFGDPLYFSKVITTALDVPGVASIDINSPKTVFQKVGGSTMEAQNTLNRAVIEVKPLEIIKVANNVTRPQDGRIEFFMD